MVISDIRAGNLEQAYLDTNNNIILLLEYTKLVMIQERLNLPGDAGLAFQVKTFQSQFRTQALYVQNQLVPAYINIVSSAGNFCSLFGAFVTLGEPLIAQDSEDSKQKASSISGILSEHAGNINQTANIAAKNLGVVNNSLLQLQKEFDSALDNAIKKLDDSATATSAEIDKLETAIKQNINDIVEGSTKVGGAVRELGIGMLTQITKVTGKAPVGKETAGEDKVTGKASVGKETAGKELEVPSVDFVVSSIAGAQEGATQTAQARAGLNSNNQKLATAYQTLAQANSLVATAKVIQVQNRMLASEMGATQVKILDIATNWGQSPVIPPGSRVSLGFDDYAQQINASVTPADTKQLLVLLKNAAISWNSLHKQLTDIKQGLTGID